MQLDYLYSVYYAIKLHNIVIYNIIIMFLKYEISGLLVFIIFKHLITMILIDTFVNKL